MNIIQKATAAAVAVIITLVGATLAAAPMVLADVPQVVSHPAHWSPSPIHFLALDRRASSLAARTG